MPFNGSGSFSPPGASFPAVASTLIESAKFNAVINDLATGLSTCITKDGQTTVTANIPFGGNKLTGVAAATARTDAATLASIQDGTGVYVGTVGGTADAITLTPSPAITAYATGQRFLFLSGGTSTGAVTVAVSSLAAKAIQTSGSALTGGEIVSGKLYAILYDGTQFQLQSLSVTPYIAKLLNDTDAATARATLGIEAARNLALSASVGSNALTISLKGIDGNDPSASNPVVVQFRNATVTTGDNTFITITAATSIVISSGSTLGTSNSLAFKIWVVGFNDGGTFRLGVINCLSGSNIYPLDGFGIASSTAEGGAGAADSAQVFYTGTAVTSKAYTVLGYVSYESGLATAGTYASAPTRTQLFNQDVKLPGVFVQTLYNSDSAVATGTTTIPNDDTIPQNTEGDQYMSQAITPTSAGNVVYIEHEGQYFNSAAGAPRMVAALFQDSTANALAAAAVIVDNNGARRLSLRHSMLAGTTSATTFKIRAGGTAAGTTTFNGESAARLFGGVYNSLLRVTEIMA